MKHITVRRKIACARLRVQLELLGLLATVELLAMGVAEGFALPSGRLRTIAFAVLAIAALADLATPFTALAGLFAARIMVGLAEGVLSRRG
ncbi:MAG: hypothetical protein M3R41_11030 [Pseudomonadota bacterium]|nr:hypothetical protein [Pseudomonadota bacterium]